MIKIERLDFVPLAYVYLEAGQYSEQDLVQDLQHLQEQLEAERSQGSKVIFVIDLHDAAPLTANQRKTLNAWRRQTHELSVSVFMSIVFVAPSQIIRGVLTAVLWLREFPVPHKVVGTLDDAAQWAIQQLQAADLPVPDRLRLELGRAFTHSRH